MRHILQFLVAGSGLGLVSSTPTRRSTPSATVRNGTVAGLHLPTYNQDAFLGIPFAEPPAGKLRLALPQPLQSVWNGTLNATEYYPRCVGYGNEQDGQVVSEDCLALNVVRPSGYEGQELPVAVWIYGGGFAQGGTIDTLYNLSYIVQNSVEISKPIIGVSIAYRLSGWGFLDSKEIREAGATNLGLRDQRLALHWIQENIAAFGGDPSKVTIWGESAGALSVGHQIVAYGGRDDNLFRGAIAESGAPLLIGQKFNMSASQAKYDAIVHDAGCSNSTDTLSCLRNLDYATLNAALNATTRYTFYPCEDGDFLQGSIHEQLKTGAFVKVPFLIGTNTDEGSFTATAGINTDDDFHNLVASYGSDEETVRILEALYPNIPAIGIPGPDLPDADKGTQFRRAAAFTGDYTFVAARRLTCQQWSAFNTTAYCYRFNVPSPLFAASTGATHWIEVAYVFDNLLRLGFGDDVQADVPDANRKLAKLMSRMWAAFVFEGNPNGHGLDTIPEWPRYDDGTGGYGENFVFDVNVTSHVERDLFRAEGIAFLNEVFGKQFGK